MSELKGQSIQVISNLNGTDLKTTRTALKGCESSVLFRVNSETFQALLTSYLFRYISFVTVYTGSGRGGPDPTFPRLFRENPVSRTFFIGFPNTAFLSKKYILKSLIITKKAHKWKRLVVNDSFDWYFEFTQFLKASAKRKSFLFLSVKRAGITICHI